MSEIQTGDPDADAFWRAAAQERLTYGRCSVCGTANFPPRDHCPACGGDCEIRDSAGRGEIVTWSRVHRSADTDFKDMLPYVVAIVALEEGFRMVANVEPQAAVAIGARCTLAFRPSPATGLLAPLFELEGAKA
ncbi:Zn-ribbon domain-containing OB-fold protein [Conexibacter sp. CPCC 206217]|uniref:Zn-ribbon domain-containing OB-fold protein n=1 Tax=Conexibacter sp. CPCC 206217 TaxID=3064574 RepID=UPI002728DDEF|nr:Zn-ribbon domain-containing OB-fold protein [Conexibacter sp. CPCC 206217]MDO8208878.1 Zn-ribbon domain-containing OB-fold protein [Conexibacter sp. CPCC 206217]